MCWFQCLQQYKLGRYFIGIDQLVNVEEEITSLLQQAFHPLHLDVTNESHMHAVPPNSETHFKVVIVSDVFNGVMKVKRHQQVYGVLKDLMNNPIHALALHTDTPAEWHENPVAPASPECMGGDK